jgi:adenylate kinase
MPLLIVVRGVCGSGKSTLSRNLCKYSPNEFVAFETDATRNLTLATMTPGLGALDREYGKRLAAAAARAAFEADRNLVVDCDYQNEADMQGLLRRVGELVPEQNLVLLRLTVGTDLAVRRKLADPTWHSGELESYRESEVRRCHRDFTPLPLSDEVVIPTDGLSENQVLVLALTRIRDRLKAIRTER